MQQQANQSYLLTQFTSFREFIKEPQYIYTEQPFSSKLKQFFTVYLLNLIAVFLVMALMGLADGIIPKELIEENKVGEMLDTMPVWLVFLFAAVLAPLWEELVFRFPLKYRAWVIHTLIALLCIIALGIIIYKGTFAAKIAFGSLVVILAALYSVFNKKIMNLFQNLWTNKFPIVFYVFTLAFALIHLGNYPLSWATVLWFPVLVLPQFVIGLFLGYVRVKLGIGWSIAFHAMHNAIFVGVFLLGTSAGFEPVKVDNKEYKLTVEPSEKTVFDEMTSILGSDSIVIKNNDFKLCLSLLLDKDLKYVEVDNSVKAEERLNIVYVKKGKAQSDEKAARAAVLSEMKKAYLFTVENSTKEVDSYEFTIVDIKKLDSYKSKTPNSSYSFDRKQISIKNAEMEWIANYVNSQYSDVEFVTTVKGGEKYTLEYPQGMTIEEFEVYFRKHFGLAFKKHKKKVEISEIVFE